MNTFFVSDTHFGHKNIVYGESEWSDLSKCRPFDTRQDMNDTIVDNINKVVKTGDILYCLGDWSFGGKENIYLFRKRLEVKTIHLILGNHDLLIEKNASILVNDDLEISSRSLFTSVQHYLTKKINGQNMVLFHYPIRSWNNGAKGTWMLHGHCHGTLPDYGPESNNDKFKTMDVGIDTHPEFRPYHFDEIAEMFKNRIDLNIDHHN